MQAKTTVIVALISSIGGGVVGNVLPALIDFDKAKTAEELKRASSELERMRASQGELARDVERQRAGRQSCTEAIDAYLAAKTP